MFKIPIPTSKSFTCDIEKNIDRVDLLKLAKLIIWNEAPMANKYYSKALDKTLKDIMSKLKTSNTIFGGKVVVLGDDF